MDVQVDHVELKESCGTTVPESGNQLNEGNSLVEDLLSSVQINGDAEEGTDHDIVDMFLLAEKSEFTVVDEAIASPKQSNGLLEDETEAEGKMEPMEESTAKESDEKLHSNECETECNVSDEEETKLLMSPQSNLLCEKNNKETEETKLPMSPQSDPLCEENNIEAEETKLPMSPQSDPLCEENNIEAEETEISIGETETSLATEGRKKNNGETDSSAEILDLQVAQSDDNESWHSADNQPSVSSKQCETTTVASNDNEKDLGVSNQAAGDAEREASIQEPEIQKEAEETIIAEKVAEKGPNTRKRKRNQSLPKEESTPVHMLRKRKIKTEVVQQDEINEVYIKEEKCDEEMLPEEVGTAAMFVKTEGSQSRSKTPKPTPQKRNLRSRSSAPEKKKPTANPNVVNCKICGRFSRIENIDAHMRTHTNPDGSLKAKPTEAEGPLVCQLCTREFQMIKSLRNHMRQKHNCTEIIRCIKCDFITTNLNEFRKHVKSHDPKLLGCDICEFKTLLKKGLRNHIEAKHGKVHKCNHCTKAFAFDDDLEVHKTQFHVKTKFRCRHCKRYFRNSDNLSRHEKACK